MVGEDQDQRILTLVLCSYNHLEYVNELLQSIENSNYLHLISLIIVDDGSRDGSDEFFLQRTFDPRLFVRIFTKANAGLTDSLALGLKQTRTDYVAFIASDDCYVPSGLDECIRRLVAQPANDLCWICQAAYMEERDGQPVYGRETADLIGSEPQERLRLLSLSFPKPLLLQSTVFGANLLRSAGAWGDQNVLDDWPTFLRIAERATRHHVKMEFIDDIVLCRYRLHAGGVHRNTDRQLKICLQVVDTLVQPPLRRRARANVYTDIGLIHLNERRPARAARLLLSAFAHYPNPALAITLARRLTRAVRKRLSKTESRTPPC
ncbi:glycosyltransferase family A protein [Qipengyuania thermophila]|uniref:glycosyltransferase family A protein n=1 Tax=Qipengyuania thermophila TaxID=2509361 RepID=UPI0013EBED18|nr:glycosyltransferase family A protein [Qipengyuania thermophila]